MKRALLFVALASCATLGEGDGGGENLPNAHAGPFRKLVQTELGQSRSAPNVLDDSGQLGRDPSVIDVDGDPSTLDVFGYFSVTIPPEGEEADVAAPPNAIARFGAIDARSFDRARELVIEPADAWEGGTVGAPSALRIGGEIWIYYAAAGGIGRATSPDGLTFTRDGAPVLAPDPAGWEAGAAPASPGVVRLDDGSFRMFYAVAAGGAGSSIGEARSDDGIAWTRLGSGPALAPAPAPLPAGEGDEPYDSLSVGSPCPVLAVSPIGGVILRVYYGAVDRLGTGVIGLAARFGNDGPLVRATSPVFGTGSTLAPREPSLLVHDDFTLLFVTQLAGRSAGKAYPAVAGGVAPALAGLPPRDPN
jgi:hypothetical protein